MVSAKVLLTGLINQSPQYVIDQAQVPIHFVVSKSDWSYCASRLLQAKLMGFDTETKPVWGKGKKRNPCALLQIAVRDAKQQEEVFVLDLLHLPAKLYNATLTSVFLSKDIVKFGQSFYQDLQELSESYPHASCFTVCKNVVEVNDLSISLAGAHNPLSLQKLVFFYLNRKLTKTQQMSNWARRPLSQSQLHYAAADALVLIHLYDELLLRIAKQQSKKFKLSDVSNVLDVNLSPTPKCSLCFEVFESATELKKHRKTCTLHVRMLAVCAVCEGRKLVTEKAMKHHVKNCGVDEKFAEPILQIKRKRSMSMEKPTDPTSSESAPSRKRRRKKAKQDAEGAESPKVEHVEASNTSPKKRKRQQKKTKADAEQDKSAEASNVDKAAVKTSEPLSAAELEVQARKKRRNAAKKARRVAKQLAKKKGLIVTLSEAKTCRGQEHKQRKMSMESSLLASDSMWSQISSDCTAAA